jgi:hypothetical protein
LVDGTYTSLALIVGVGMIKKGFLKYKWRYAQNQLSRPIAK